MWSMFKVNNKDTRTTSNSALSLLLTLKRFHSFLMFLMLVFLQRNLDHAGKVVGTQSIMVFTFTNKKTRLISWVHLKLTIKAPEWLYLSVLLALLNTSSTKSRLATRNCVLLLTLLPKIRTMYCKLLWTDTINCLLPRTYFLNLFQRKKFTKTVNTIKN